MCIGLQTLGLYIKRIILDVLSCNLLSLLNIMFSGFIHVVSETLFHYFLLLHHSIVWILHNLFSLSTVDGYLVFSQYFVSTITLP